MANNKIFLWNLSWILCVIYFPYDIKNSIQHTEYQFELKILALLQNSSQAYLKHCRSAHFNAFPYHPIPSYVYFKLQYRARHLSFSSLLTVAGCLKAALQPLEWKNWYCFYVLNTFVVFSSDSSSRPEIGNRVSQGDTWETETAVEGRINKLWRS